MSQGRTTPIWLIALAVIVVFAVAMTVTAPRSWERTAPRTALAPAKSFARPVHRSAYSSAEYASDDGSPRSPLPSWGRPASPSPRIASRHRPVADPGSLPLAVPTAGPRQAETGAIDVPQPTTAALHAIGQDPTPLMAPTPLTTPSPFLPSLGADLPPLGAGLPSYGFPSLGADFPSLAPSLSPIAPTLPTPAVAPMVETPTVETPIVETVVATPFEEPEPAEEPPSLDRPRLWGGLPRKRVTAPTPVAVAAKPAVVLPTIQRTPTIQPTPTVQPTPTLQPTPVVQPAPTIEPTPIIPVTPAVAAPIVTQPAAPTEIHLGPTLEPRPAPAVAVTTTPEPQKPAAPEPAPITPPASTPIVAEPGGSWWPTLTADLTDGLQKLGGHGATRVWAERTSANLDALAATDDVAAAEAATCLADLRRNAAEALQIDERQLDASTAVELRLARYALVRRLDVWESLAAAVRYDRANRELATSEAAGRLEASLADVVAQTDAAGDVGRQWREYLLLDALAGACSMSEAERRREVARQASARLAKAEAAGEHTFLREGAFAELGKRLAVVGEDEIDAHQLLVDLERFEQGGLPTDARALAAECRRLSESLVPAKQNLAVWLNSHYRNANVRVSFSPELLNRLLPDSLKRQHPVNETILGKETRGWGSTRTGLTVRFAPHSDRVAVVLTAEGVVNAQTRTFSGPVRLFNFSNSAFAAEKEIELTSDGVAVKPSRALSRNNTRLRGVESDFDGMPLLNGLITAIAQNQHAEKKPLAQREAALKVSEKVEKQLDEDMEKHLRQADEKLHARLIEPLSRLGIEPAIVDLQSREERATIRIRSAAAEQLAANTPRPRALADNLGSVQLHQSAINNVLDRLELRGRHFTLREFYRYVTGALNLPGKADLSQLPEEMSLTFAATDPMTIRCDEGRIELRLAIDELRHGERVWRDFTIRALFRPQNIDEIHYLVRDDVVRISGRQLGTTQQISLRTVFAKIFPEDLRVRLWPERLVDDPRFKDLDIAQIDLRDGWIGVAIGPRAELTTPVAPQAPAPPHAIGGGLLKSLRR